METKSDICECEHRKGSHNSDGKGYRYCRIRGCLCKKFKKKEKDVVIK